jgi:Mg-chelatase subunit ChlD
MRNRIVLALLFLLPALSFAGASSQTSTHPSQQAIIDVAFCLDTTGSMSGLLEGAKAKIWSIVNTVATAKPRPVLRIALIGYRDLQDAYVTRDFDFTQDLETMYTHLREYRADGGGDTPEHVNQALYEAVHKLSWSKNPAALKIVYLVGDAPPHMDYQDGYDYRKISKAAAASGIIINTIQCGAIAGTQQVWQEIARIAEGKYAAIDQSGGVAFIHSPYDSELARLSGELNKTYVAYGGRGRTNLVTQRDHDVAAAMEPSAAAERAATKASPLYKNESWDLVDAVREDSGKLDKIATSDLPAELRNLPREKQEAYLEKKQQDRIQIQQKIQELTKKRDAYVESEKKKSGTGKDAFDSQVLSTLKEQGKDKGITFE